MNPSAGNKITLSPQPDEVEVSVFGPGYGECILIHAGYNRWLIVDSCINPFSGEVSALTYLRGLGVNPASSVFQVIATHWHDDHIRGLGDIVSECTSAEFVCSDALRPKEFLTLVKACGERSMMDTSGVSEFQKVIGALEQRKARNGQATPKFAIANRLLWQRSDLDIACSVHSLSPSDQAVSLAFRHISKLLPDVPMTKKRLPAQSPNHAAVVLWVCVGNSTVLLGADLEEHGGSENGWSVIVGSKERPPTTASLIKIPHHGSCNADCPQVWAEMLVSQPLAVLTPYARGRKPLPSGDDVNRICSRTEHGFSTASVEIKGKRKRSSVVEKQIKETVRSIRPIDSSSGHVRFRAKALGAATWHAELFGDALQLKQLYAS